MSQDLPEDINNLIANFCNEQTIARLGLCSTHCRDKVWIDYIPAQITFRQMMEILHSPPSSTTDLDGDTAQAKAAAHREAMKGRILDILDRLLKSSHQFVRYLLLEPFDRQYMDETEISSWFAPKALQLIKKSAPSLLEFTWYLSSYWQAEISEQNRGIFSSVKFPSLLMLHVEELDIGLFSLTSLFEGIAAGNIPRLIELNMRMATETVESTFQTDRATLCAALKRVSKTIENVSIRCGRDIGYEPLIAEESLGADVMSNPAQWHRCAEVFEKNIGIKIGKLFVNGSTLFAWIICNAESPPSVEQTAALYNCFFPSNDDIPSTKKERQLRAWMQGDALCFVPYSSSPADFASWAAAELEKIASYGAPIYWASGMNHDLWFRLNPILGAAVRIINAATPAAPVAAASALRHLEKIFSMNGQNLFVFASLLSESWNDRNPIGSLVADHIDPDLCKSSLAKIVPHERNETINRFWRACTSTPWSEDEQLEKFVSWCWRISGGKISDDLKTYISTDRQTRSGSSPSSRHEVIRNLIHKLGQDHSGVYPQD